MLGGRRKSRRERRLAAAEALEEAKEQDTAAAKEAAAMLAATAAQDSGDPPLRTGLEGALPKPRRSQRCSSGAASAQHQCTPQGWTFDGNSSRGGDADQAIQWPPPPRDAVQPNRRTDASGRLAAAMHAPVDRNHAVTGSGPNFVANAAGVDGQSCVRSNSEPVASTPEYRAKAGSATAPGWNFGSWWQSLSALNPKKPAQQVQRRAKA